MPYSKTTWVDRVVQFANRYTKSNETSSSVTLTADPGTVTQAGTPLNAGNLNKMEQGIADANDPTTILTNLKTVDGAGSGLDADMVRGKTVVPTDGTVPFTGNPVVQKDIARFDFDRPAGGANAHQGLRFLDNGTQKANLVYDLVNDKMISFRASSGLFLDMWDSGMLRWNSSGYLEYNNGGAWVPVGAYGSSRKGSSTLAPNAIGNFLSLSGSGILNSFALGNTANGGASTLEIVVDGVSWGTMTYNASASSSAPQLFVSNLGYLATYIDNQSYGMLCNIAFKSSLVVRFITSSTVAGTTSSFYGYTLL